MSLARYERGKDTSPELTEVRTVLRRAETALEGLDRKCVAEQDWRGMPVIHDPDTNDMIDALLIVVQVLDRWRRTGRK